MRRIATITAVGLVALALPIAASAQAPTSFTADLAPANDSGATATAEITLDGNMAQIDLTGQGFFDGFPHAIHLHGEPGGDNVCPPAMNPGDPDFDAVDEDGDGIMSVVEGAPFYGGVAVSLTTEGDTTPDSALAVDRFPTSGTLDYARTIELPDDVAANLSSLHVVVHGLDLDDSGEIGTVEIPSSLDPDLPIEATAPAACGQLTAAAAGGIDTGAGGTASTNGLAGLLAGGLLLGGFGAFAARRRNADGSA